VDDASCGTLPVDAAWTGGLENYLASDYAAWARETFSRETFARDKALIERLGLAAK
jgi:hypothetical protein